MATRSRIGIELECGQIKSIYCHFDGYLQGVGLMLHEHYQDKTKVEKLIALGDISFLDEEVDIPEGVEHSFNNTHPGITVAYHRDREESLSFSIDHSRKKFFEKGIRYLFTKEGVWVVDTFDGVMGLEEKLRLETIIE
jgi:hypothetical protein